jgi:hypothetical protein
VIANYFHVRQGKRGHCGCPHYARYAGPPTKWKVGQQAASLHSVCLQEKRSLHHLQDGVCQSDGQVLVPGQPRPQLAPVFTCPLDAQYFAAL